MSKLLKEFIKQVLLEDIPPKEEHTQINWYHGCPSYNFAQQIMKFGYLESNIERSTYRGESEEPRKNKVYITQNLNTALGYGIGEYHYQDEEDEVFDENDELGFLFVIPGDRLKDVEPDEDMVRDYLIKHRFTSDNTLPMELDWVYDYLIQIMHNDIHDISENPAFLMHYVNSEELIEFYNTGDYYSVLKNVDSLVWAKLLLDYLKYDSEKMKLLMNFVSLENLAHDDKIFPKFCFKFRKSQIKNKIRYKKMILNQAVDEGLERFFGFCCLSHLFIVRPYHNGVSDEIKCLG